MEEIKFNYEQFNCFREDCYGKVILKQGKKEMQVIYAPNLDVYLALNNFQDDPTFVIGKDNTLLYNLFDKLYLDIINFNVYPLNVDEIVERAEFMEQDYHTVLRDEEIYHKNFKKRLKDIAKYEGFIKKGEIIWMSDDYPVEVAPEFRIKKLENAYVFTFNNYKFKKGANNHFYDIYLNDKEFISVRVRMSGSRYDPFNVLFMELFSKLKEMTFYESLQIGIEEYLILNKVKDEESLKRILLKK